MQALLAIADDNTGYQALFEQDSLDGWRGHKDFWQIEAGVVRGHSDTALESTQYLVSEASFGDFALQFEARVSAEGFANTGIFYRCILVSEEELLINGYQMDIDFTPWLHWTGGLYDERGYKSYGKLLSFSGQRAWIDGDDGRLEVQRFQDADTLVAAMKKNAWQRYTVVAKGGRLIHRIDDQVYSDVILDAPQRSDGFLAFQLHEGAAMTAEFKNVRIKALSM
jgi:hypothetical protein